MKRQLIVAKFKENLAWLSNIDIPSVIYDKSQDIPNVGYEAHTYLYHIVNHWNELADISIFTQGNPYDHCIDFNQKILNIPDDVKFINIHNGGTFHSDYVGRPHHTSLDLSKLWHVLSPLPLPKRMTFHAGAVFVVALERIRLYPFESYQTLLGMIITKDDACAMERLWKYIFNYPIKSL